MSSKFYVIGYDQTGPYISATFKTKKSAKEYISKMKYPKDYEIDTRAPF